MNPVNEGDFLFCISQVTDALCGLIQVLFHNAGVESESGRDDAASSDSSTGNSVSCPICLLKFKGQAIGYPDVCGHPFCLDCILEWSKVCVFFFTEIVTGRLVNVFVFFSLQNVQTCPIDRRTFAKIAVRLDLDGEIVRRIPVKAAPEPAEDALLSDITLCQVF